MYFPKTRLRRLRQENLREMLDETQISPTDLIYPLFVCHGENIKDEISSMPGCYRFSIDKLIEEMRDIKNLGIKAVMLFGIPEKKDFTGSEAYADNGIIQKAVREIKGVVKDVLIVTDVCLCEYTDHGHCGIIENDEIKNDISLKYIAQTALSQARAGSDIIAPSDMMDGRVGAIRSILDENDFPNIPIMSYSAKFCSAFYGPFREAADSAPRFGDRKTYQMNPSNRREALREIFLDIDEGADIVMVKPALSYLDIIREARNNILHPIAAYNVSGEYSMVKAASKMGWIDEKRIVLEILTSIKRAGADLILTYHAKDAALWLS